MKKLLALLLAVVLLVGCSKDPNKKFYGTWSSCAVEHDGTVLTMEELEQIGSTSFLEFYIVIKEGGSAFIQSAGLGISNAFEWTSSDGKVKIGNAECQIDEDGKMVVAFPDANMLLEKISESQDFADIKAIQSEEEKNKEAVAQQSSDDIRPEFKQIMDDYEAFFDRYIEFMQDFNNTDNVLSMMTDYLDFMDKYQDAMDSMEELENSDLSPAELRYYTEVTLKIEEKLLSAI